MHFPKITYTTTLFGIVFLHFSALSQSAPSLPHHSDTAFHHPKIESLEIPKLHPHEEIVKHAGYTLSYNEQHEQANWVAYELTDTETVKQFNRTDRFKPDPAVKTHTADNIDYQGFGYDRGHLAPAADMGWSAITMDESFYFSNMSPQEPSFNRGIWKKMEDLVRSWAVEYKAVYVVVGPVLKPNLHKIGVETKVSVPEYYYKVVLDKVSHPAKGLAFLIQNHSSSEPLSTFAFSIDSVESLTGIDFFPLLPDEEEHNLESNLCIPCWDWNKTKLPSLHKQTPLDSDTNKGNDNHNQAESVQCKGLTQKGERCKNHTHNQSGYCHIHEK